VDVLFPGVTSVIIIKMNPSIHPMQEKKPEGICPIHGNFFPCKECQESQSSDELESEDEKALSKQLNIHEELFYNLISQVPNNERVFPSFKEAFSNAAIRKNAIERMVELYKKTLTREEQYLAGISRDLKHVEEEGMTAVKLLCEDFQLQMPDPSAIHFVGRAGYLKLFLQHNAKARLKISASAGEYIPEIDQLAVFVYPGDRLTAEMKDYLVFVLIHELIHYLGCPVRDGEGKTVGHGISGYGTKDEYGKYGFIEEGFDEMLAYKYASALWEGKVPARIKFEYDQGKARRLVSLLARNLSSRPGDSRPGLDLLAGAHFNGRLQELREGIERVYGEGSFDFMYKIGSYDLRGNETGLNFMKVFLANPAAARTFLRSTVQRRETRLPVMSFDPDDLKEILYCWGFYEAHVAVGIRRSFLTPSEKDIELETIPPQILAVIPDGHQLEYRVFSDPNGRRQLDLALEHFVEDEFSKFRRG